MDQLVHIGGKKDGGVADLAELNKDLAKPGVKVQFDTPTKFTIHYPPKLKWWMKFSEDRDARDLVFYVTGLILGWVFAYWFH